MCFTAVRAVVSRRLQKSSFWSALQYAAFSEEGQLSQRVTGVRLDNSRCGYDRESFYFCVSFHSGTAVDYISIFTHYASDVSCRSAVKNTEAMNS